MARGERRDSGDRIDPKGWPLRQTQGTEPLGRLDDPAAIIWAISVSLICCRKKAQKAQKRKPMRAAGRIFCAFCAFL